MSSPTYYAPSEFETLSIEEQIKYVETHLDEVVSGIRNADIPESHKEILIKVMGHYRSSYEQAITWEDFEKELDKELNKS